MAVIVCGGDATGVVHWDLSRNLISAVEHKHLFILFVKSQLKVDFLPRESLSSTVRNSFAVPEHTKKKIKTTGNK